MLAASGQRYKRKDETVRAKTYASYQFGGAEKEPQEMEPSAERVQNEYTQLMNWAELYGIGPGFSRLYSKRLLFYHGSSRFCFL